VESLISVRVNASGRWMEMEKSRTLIAGFGC
jgi:hypothetical protein